MIGLADLNYRVGGDVGRHGRRLGPWFDPAIWALIAATITWLIVMLRQVPCRPVLKAVEGSDVPEVGFPDAFMRLCYSDIPTLYLGRGISTGAGFYTEVPLEYPVLTGYFMEVARTITKILGGEVHPEASFVDQVAASQIFFQVCAVGLFICFVGTVVVHLKMGRGRATDALLIAASPVVMANGLINWDMLPLLLTSLGLLVWARKFPFLAGGVLGLAFAAKFYPILVLIALTLLCVRADRYAALVRLWLGAALTWVVVNVPMIAAAPEGWSTFWTMNADRGADLGSIWYVLSLVSLRVPALSAVAFSCMALCGIGVVWLVLKAPRRPRVGQVVLLLMVIFLVFNKVYSPQYALWLLPLVVLARPHLPDVAIWTLGELIYYVCIWGFLQGLLGPGTGGDALYWAAVIIRICTQLWFCLRVIDDIWQPWFDPVRKPLVDDPIGGVLSHTPDALWLEWLNHRPRRAAAEPAPVS